MTAILTAQNVTKAFGNRRVLQGVSCALHERDRVGLVGVNGTGKSTLLRMLVGEPGHDNVPDTGLITRRRGLRVALVPQEPIIEAAPTVRATLRAGLRPDPGATAENDYEVRELAAALGLTAALDVPVGAISIGERRRVAIGRALLSRPELLALDEPTNHLDARTVEWLEERLLASAGALLLVTHDRFFLDRVATRILELDRGQLYAYEGGYTRFLERQAERLDNEAARERERASFVRRELDWIRRGPSARGTKQQARIDRFEAAVAARPVDGPAAPLELRLPSGGRLGKTVLELRGLSISRGGRRLLDGLDLIMRPQDRIGIVGANGVGKTTLLRTIVGLAPPDAGEVVVGQNTRIAFLDQERAELRDDRTVLEEVAGDSEHIFLEEGPVHVRTFLRRMLFDDGFADTPVGKLSGGERNRVQLAKLLRAGGNLLVLDEPTNDLDIITLGVLEAALVELPGCALVVSHDRWFLDRIATAILAIEGDGRVELHAGSYTSYLARRRAGPTSAVPAPTTAVAVPPSTRHSRTGPRKRTFKETQELGAMEAAILAAEERVATLEHTLNDPAVYRERALDVPRLVAELEAARAEVLRLYARWQELEDLECVPESRRRLLDRRSPTD
ncbi:MAG: ABC-F family ATP-binding cassette domain-containing protein [Pseudomonadota bacterium]